MWIKCNFHYSYRLYDKCTHLRCAAQWISPQVCQHIIKKCVCLAFHAFRTADAVDFTDDRNASTMFINYSNLSLVLSCRSAPSSRTKHQHNTHTLTRIERCPRWCDGGEWWSVGVNRIASTPAQAESQMGFDDRNMHTHTHNILESSSG